jgi:hypothetical protein
MSRGEFSVKVRRQGEVRVVDVGGSMGVLGSALLGSRLLALLDGDGEQRVLVDLEAARAIAPSALLATLLRVDRCAGQRGASVVVVGGPLTRPALETRGAQRWLTVAGSRDEALVRLDRSAVEERRDHREQPVRTVQQARPGRDEVRGARQHGEL